MIGYGSSFIHVGDETGGFLQLVGLLPSELHKDDESEHKAQPRDGNHEEGYLALDL